MPETITRAVLPFVVQSVHIPTINVVYPLVAGSHLPYDFDAAEWSIDNVVRETSGKVLSDQ